MVSGYPDWHKGVKADIIAQTLEKMLVDIAAVSVGDLGVDIKAQTISKLDIDITAQSIAELVSFWKVGKSYAGRGGWYADPKATPTVISVSGKGVLLFYLVLVEAATGSHYVGMDIIADGGNVSGFTSFDMWNDYGFGPNTAPFSLLKYAVDGKCVGAFVPRVPLTFDTSLELRVANYSDYAQSGSYLFAYTVL